MHPVAQIGCRVTRGSKVGEDSTAATQLTMVGAGETPCEPRAFIVDLPSERLVQVRRNRLTMLHQKDGTEYTDLEQVRDEVAQARRLFLERKWPMIDVSRRSIEETAAAVMNLYQERVEAQQA